MAAKLLHSLADDNPDLQKQIGCMTGIFHMFDRQHLVSGRRLNQRRLLPPPPSSGNSNIGNGNLDADSDNVYDRGSVERNLNKYINDKQRGSTESSRASFSSSSRSSSFSSLDCGRTGHPEASSIDRIIFPETPSRDPAISQRSASPKMGRLSVDLRDVVKDSMYRDSRGLSVQIIKEDGSSHSAKPKDSPRPLQISKSVNATSEIGMKGNTVPADIRESLRALAKLRDSQCNYNAKDPPRLSYESKEGFSVSVQRDAPRLSYDGREANRKLKDLPRLSLDSRDSSARSFIMDSKPASPSGNLNRDSDWCNESVTNLVQSSANQSRPSSVVAKLMGLDMLPDTKPSCESNFGPIKTSRETNGSSLAPLRFPDTCRPVRLPKSPRRKESTSPRWKNADMKPVSSSKFPIEPAPWKNVDSGRASPKQASRQVKSSVSTLSSSPSVFGEMEKRLKDIEFNQSGKDLRALKQILEAMQAKGFLEARKEDQFSSTKDNRDNVQRVSSDVNAGFNSNDSRTSRTMASKTKGRGTSKAFESPIVIMKPAKLVQKSSSTASSFMPMESLPGLQSPQSSDGPAQRKTSSSSRITKDQTIRDSRRDQGASSADRRLNNRNSRVTQTSRSPQVARDSTTNSVKSSGSISPRLQQKKLEFERRSRPPTPPSDSNKVRRQPSRQSTESVSPGGRRRLLKTSNVSQTDEHSSERSTTSRSCQEDNASMNSDTNLTVESKVNVEHAFTEKPVEFASCQSPSEEACKLSMSSEAKQDVSLRLCEEDTVRDFTFGPEQPSPVSVLDSSVYMEGSPSPVKQASHVLEGDSITESGVNASEEVWNSVDNPFGNNTDLELPSEISRKKLQSIDNLVQKLRRLNSTHDEAQTDYIASLCENTNPDHRYISEILLASGLLLRELSSGLTAFQLHPSGHPINPELFFVLEQTKASSLLAKGENNPDEIAFLKSKPEKYHRKLLFDTVNELLVGKLALVGPPPEPWLKPEQLAKKSLNAQKLLRELCAEVELLQAKKQEFSLEEEEDVLKSILFEDVMHRSDNFTNFQSEVSNVVLDVERSIFKDLVDEIVRGEGAGVQGKPNRRCRQLFSK